MNINLPCVVSIAGTDPSGGAGIQADIKSISATGSYAATVITVLVAQNTQGVQSVYSIPADFVMNQINSVFEDLKVSAVKIGMLHSYDIINLVSSALEKYQPKNIILDPVMAAKDDTLLLDLAKLDFFKSRLFSLIDVITPNLFETEKIICKKIISLDNMAQAAKEIGRQYKINVLIKGGHFKEDKSSDVLYSFINESINWFHSMRIDTKNTHGTGCTLSSAIASFLAQGYSLLESVKRAKLYLTNSLKSGNNIKIGRGRGPVDHFYFLRETNKRKELIFE